MNNRIALVCGGSKGIGWACAKALAQEGARIILLARGEALLKQRTEELEGSGATAAFLTGDLSLIPSLPGLVDQASSIFGPIEILINNTGGPPSGPPLSFSADVWERAFRGTFLSAEVTTRLFLPRMAERGWGRIINLTSVSVRQPIEGLVLSNSIRMAVIGWAKTLAREYAPKGITINSIATGITTTERVEELIQTRVRESGRSPEEIRQEMVRSIPIGRMARPEEIAAAVAFLAGDRASYITGTVLPVDGGYILGA